MVNLKSGLTISYDESFKTAAEKLQEYFKLFYNIEIVEVKSGGDILFIKSDCKEEYFYIEVKCGKITIGATELKGAIYAASKLIEIIDRKTLTVNDTYITEGPYKKVRGVHMYLPSRENINTYKRILDILAFFKMNTVIIEVSGAMQYEKHPEINKAWEWFCDLADNKFPGVGKSRSLQWADIYWKDSVHTEHAGGSYLTKIEVSDIVGYAKSMGFNVIPEIQALSHSYYLTLAHREIAEVQDDMFPDSYCPLNEKSYELYFDVAEEVIEVFKPSAVSIGHDEVRILGQCEKCRQKTGHELLSYEINRLHKFYESHGIKIFMWGDMLQHYRNYKGVMMGEGVDTITDYGFRYTLPQTYKAKYSIPKEITVLDWHYSLSYDSEKRFEDDGFKTIYGNFRGSKILNWSNRSKSENMMGAEVSTWCVTDEETFARDGIFFEIIFSAHILWENDYTDEKYENTASKVMSEMYITKALMRREISNILKPHTEEVVYCSKEEKSVSEICIKNAIIPSAEIAKSLKQYGDTLYAVPIDTEKILIEKEFYADSILFFHSAKKDMPFIPSHQFPDDSALGIGTYAVLYEDGMLELANIIYGKTVGPLEFEFKIGGGDDASFEIDNDTGEDTGSVKAPTFGHKSEWNGSIVYGTSPVMAGESTVFAYEWKNPYPDKKIVKIRAINTCKDKKQCALLFGMSAVKVNRKEKNV